MNQVKHWMDIAGTLIDALLVLRIFQLRLQGTYIFITLACVLSVAFDGMALRFGPESREFTYFFIYSRFLYVFVFPAAAFDVWEEIHSLVARLRRVALFRMVASLVLAAVLGLIIASVASAQDSSDDATLASFAIIIWAASSAASLAFLWSMHRLTKAAKIELTNNTSVWLLYFQLSLAAEVVACFLIIIGQQFSALASNAMDFSLGLYAILITLWCIWKLRPQPSANISSNPESSVP